MPVCIPVLFLVNPNKYHKDTKMSPDLKMLCDLLVINSSGRGF